MRRRQVARGVGRAHVSRQGKGLAPAATVVDLALVAARARLGEPVVDPHGDPIPTVTLEIEECATRGLESLEPGERGVFTRVSDSEPAMLRFLAERGIAPGDRLEVVDKQPFDGPVFVRFSGAVEVLGGGLARAMRVRLDPER